MESGISIFASPPSITGGSWDTYGKFEGVIEAESFLTDAGWVKDSKEGTWVGPQGWRAYVMNCVFIRDPKELPRR